MDTGTLFTGAYPGGASPNKIGRVGFGVSSRVYRPTFSGAGAWCCCCCCHSGAVVGGGAPTVPPDLNTALRAGSFKISVTLASHCFVGSPAWLTKFWRIPTTCGFWRIEASPVWLCICAVNKIMRAACALALSVGAAATTVVTAGWAGACCWCEFVTCGFPDFGPRFSLKSLSLP